MRRLAAEDPAGVAAAAHPLSPRYARPATAAGTLDSAVAAASRLVPPEELVEAEGTNGGGARAPVSAEARWRAAARRVPEGPRRAGPTRRAEGAARFSHAAPVVPERHPKRVGRREARPVAISSRVRAVRAGERRDASVGAPRVGRRRVVRLFGRDAVAARRAGGGAVAAVDVFVPLAGFGGRGARADETPSRASRHCAFFSAHAFRARERRATGRSRPRRSTRRLKTAPRATRTGAGTGRRRRALASHACVRRAAAFGCRPRDLSTRRFPDRPRPERALPGAAVRRGRAPRFEAPRRREVDAGAEGASGGRAVAEGSAPTPSRGGGRLAYLNALAERTSARANDPGGGGGGGYGRGDSPARGRDVEDAAAPGGTGPFRRNSRTWRGAPRRRAARRRDAPTRGERGEEEPEGGGDMSWEGTARPLRAVGGQAAGDGVGVPASMRVIDLRSPRRRRREGEGENAAGGKRVEDGQAREVDVGAREEEGAVSEGFLEAPEEAIAETSAAGNESPAAEEASEASAEEASASASASSASSASSLPPSPTAPRLLALSPLLVERLGWGAVSPAAAQLRAGGSTPASPRLRARARPRRRVARGVRVAGERLRPSDAACARDGGARWTPSR